MERGDLTLWLAPDAIAEWQTVGGGKRRGQLQYSDVAIETALTPRLVFHQPLRQTEGFLCSIFWMAGLDLSVPDHTTLSRRNRNVLVPALSRDDDRPIHLIVDSTGLKIYGAGEWCARKHRKAHERGGWRKLHIGVDDDGYVVAETLTQNTVDDADRLPDLLGQVNTPLRRVTGDGAYDTRSVYTAVGEAGGTGVEVGLSPRTDMLHLPARVVVTPLVWLMSADAPRIFVGELSRASARPMIGPMTTTARPQRRYDHRLRDLVYRTGDVTIATDLGVPRSTARGWLRRAPEVAVSLDVTQLSEQQLQREVLQLRRRVQKLAAVLRLVLAVLRASGFTLSRERLPGGCEKMRILRAIEQARACIPLRALLQFLSLSPSRFHAWRRQDACALDDQSSCPRTSPHRLTPSEVRVIEEMVTAPEYRHVPTGHARCPRAAARPGLGVPVDLVPPRADVRLASAAAPCAPGEAEDWAPNHTRRRDVAHRHHRHPPVRRDPRLPPRGDRQLLATDLGVAGR